MSRAPPPAPGGSRRRSGLALSSIPGGILVAAPTPEGRLICACNCAYDVAAAGPLPTDPASTYYAGAGFTATPTAFASGDQHIDACLVGTTADGVVLAFRGTLTFNFNDRASLRDWLNNFAALPVQPTWLPNSPARA